MSVLVAAPKTFPYQWAGEQFSSGRIAIDCETTLASYPAVPTLVLTSVSDGIDSYILREVDELRSFLELHSDREFIAHNCAFDHAVIVKALGDDSQLWWEIVDDGRLRDTMLADALIGLAEHDRFPRNRDLGTVARAYVKRGDINKADPFRMRYSELLKIHNWSTADPGFFGYAIKDAEVTAQVWDAQVDRMRSFGAGKWGWLTDRLQVWASIALGEIERRGMRIDLDSVGSMGAEFQCELTRMAAETEALARERGFEIFKRHAKTGELILSVKTGKPSKSTKILTELVAGIADELDIAPEYSERTGKLSLNAPFWKQYREHDSFINTWQEFEETSTLCRFFGGLTTERVHPRYSVLVRNGRTSSSSPNVQQLPRREGFRELFLPSDGHFLFAIDYSSLELRALAVVCLKRYGFSELAEQFKAGIDPHTYAAQQMLNIDRKEWRQLPKSEKAEHRRKAKAVNFGLSGGLGARSLAKYAAAAYGVTMTTDEAQELRQKFTNEIFPELGEYLREDTSAIVADNVDCLPSDVELNLPGALLGSFGKVLRENPTTRDGEPYSDEFIERLWESVEAVNQNWFLLPAIQERRTGPDVHRAFFGCTVSTLTGRIRNNVTYSQFRNTGFSGLSADGTKLAMYRLIRAGFKVCAFIHDEFLIELPIESDHRGAALKIEKICREAMLEVFNSNVPVECGYWLSDKWRKNAEAVWGDNGELLPWIPDR